MNRRDALRGAVSTTLLLAAGCAVADPFGLVRRKYTDRPAMMAIGDSLYQGVRSLSYTPETSSFSVPALVAGALGNTAFTVSTPPRPILWDIENIIRQQIIFETLLLFPHVRSSAAAWRNGSTWSADEAFDNVAVGGAEIDTLYTDTYDMHLTKFENLYGQLITELAPINVLADIWYSLNSCFTLNPRRREAQRNRTQIQQVADRKPQILLVNIGSNEGLFSAAFQGNISAANQSLPASLAKMQELAKQLAGLPNDVERIFFNSLVRPRTASNLMPADSPTKHYPNDGYYDTYGPWLFRADQPIPRATLMAFDHLVDEQNKEVESLMRSQIGSRFAFVDLYEMSNRFDAKHYGDRGLGVEGHYLENVPLNGKPGRFGGGLTGLDNMHPTVPGYALIADAVLEAMGSSARVDKPQALRNDTLLSNIPPLLDETHNVVLAAVNIIRDIGQVGLGAQTAVAPASHPGG